MGKLHPHHRRPRSLGGNNAPYNKSYVESTMHCAWHNIFGNMNAYQIANHINEMSLPYKPDNMYIICKFINGEEVQKTGASDKNFTKDASKMEKSWNRIFYKMDFYEIVKYINNVWLDSSYHLYVKRVMK